MTLTSAPPLLTYLRDIESFSILNLRKLLEFCLSEKQIMIVCYSISKYYIHSLLKVFNFRMFVKIEGWCTLRQIIEQICNK